MEIKLNITAEQADALLAAAHVICKTTPEEVEASAFQALIDAIEAASEDAEANTGRGDHFAPCTTCGISCEAYDEAHAIENHDAFADHAYTGWTSSVQVAITTTDGTPVTDIATARGILADLFIPGLIFTEDIDNEGDGIYLTSVPAELYQEASEEGGAVVSHSGGYILEIPMD